MENLKKSVKLKLAKFKTDLKDWSQTFRKNFQETKDSRKSRRKALFLGFTSSLAISGITLLTPVLSAAAKYLPNNTNTSGQPRPPGPSNVCPTPNSPPTVSSKNIISGAAGAAATVCALAVSSGFFMLGAACDIIVAFGIIKAQNR